MFCFGEETCGGTTIRDITKLNCYGENSMSGSRIESSNIDNNNNNNNSNTSNLFNMKIYDTSNENGATFWLYCNKHDNCTIDCLSSNACENLYLNCLSDKCHVNCDEMNGISCPIVGDDSVYIYTKPSQAPSTIPSAIPSMPSQEPSTNPTVIPSTPSGMPSRMPSIMSTMSTIPTSNTG